MLMLPASDIADWDTDAMRARLSFFEVASPPRSRLRPIAHLAPPIARRIFWSAFGRAQRVLRRAAPPPGLPMGIDDWCPRWFRRRVATVALGWRPDVLLIEYVFLSACLDELAPDAGPSPLKLIDTHDVMHLREAAYADAGLPVGWFHTTRAEERRGLERGDIILAIQENDAEVFRRMLPDKAVLVVPHGHPVEPAPPEAAHRSRLVFVGSDNDFNVSGLRWFLAEVWPGLREKAPDIELVVCGNIARSLPNPPRGVRLLGIVRCLAEEYARSRVVINPIRGGTGLKVKVAEALCHGRPVVSTGVGALGVATGASHGVIVADTPSDFAAELLRLLDDETRWLRVAAAAAAQASSRFSTETAFGPLFDHVAGALQRASSRRASDRGPWGR
jgi:glycosyltransferase involved in cell wall biosynthesis